MVDDEQRIKLIELDPRVVKELKDVGQRLEDTLARLKIIEIEVEQFVGQQVR